MPELKRPERDLFNRHCIFLEAKTFGIFAHRSFHNMLNNLKNF